MAVHTPVLTTEQKIAVLMALKDRIETMRSMSMWDDDESREQGSKEVALAEAAYRIVSDS